MSWREDLTNNLNGIHSIVKGSAPQNHVFWAAVAITLFEWLEHMITRGEATSPRFQVPPAGELPENNPNHD
jgi:hypothetical protein